MPKKPAMPEVVKKGSDKGGKKGGFPFPPKKKGY